MDQWYLLRWKICIRFWIKRTGRKHVYSASKEILTAEEIRIQENEHEEEISIVIPTYNEEANVVPLSKAVIEVMERDLSEYDYEILFIDNHSKDNTQALLRGLCANNKKIKAIFNAKNFGQARSPVYGMKQGIWRLRGTSDCRFSGSG